MQQLINTLVCQFRGKTSMVVLVGSWSSMGWELVYDMFNLVAVYTHHSLQIKVLPDHTALL